MKKPLRSEFGYSKKTGWQDDRDRDLYDAALLQWYNQPRQMGKARTRPIHPSWEPILQHFDSTNPLRSQGAFCRWADFNRGTFSAMQCKPIEPIIAAYINAWVENWDKPEIDFPIYCALCETELTNKGEVFFSREMLYVDSAFYLLEQPECEECHELNKNGDFAIMPQFQSEYERLMEKD